MPLGCTLYCTMSQVSWCPRQSLKYHSPLIFSLHKHIPTDASTDKASIGESPTIPRRSSITIPSYLGPEEQNSNTDQTLKYPLLWLNACFRRALPLLCLFSNGCENLSPCIDRAVKLTGALQSMTWGKEKAKGPGVLIQGFRRQTGSG